MILKRDDTCNLSRPNYEGNDTYKNDEEKLKHFEKCFFK